MNTILNILFIFAIVALLYPLVEILLFAIAITLDKLFDTVDMFFGYACRIRKSYIVIGILFLLSVIHLSNCPMYEEQQASIEVTNDAQIDNSTEQKDNDSNKDVKPGEETAKKKDETDSTIKSNTKLATYKDMTLESLHLLLIDIEDVKEELLVLNSKDQSEWAPQILEQWQNLVARELEIKEEILRR